MKTRDQKRDVVTYGHAVLREKARPVGRIDAAIRGLAAEMLEVMRRRNGVGLAAHQVGEPLAVFVAQVPREELEKTSPGGHRSTPVAMPLVAINPEVSEPAGSICDQEGCLSFPEIYVPVSRAEAVTVTFQDLDGARRTIRAAGLFARVVQHESDHLNGILLVDRMSAVKKVALAGRLKKLKKQAQDGAAG